MTNADDFATMVLPQVRQLWSRLDPVPAGLTEDIKYALTVRLLEAEVAELTRMTALASRTEAGELTRSVSFTGSRLSLMATVTEDGETLRLDCWVTVGGAEVELHADGRVWSQTTDEVGRAAFDDVPKGSVHFIVWPDATKQDRPTITPAIDL